MDESREIDVYPPIASKKSDSSEEEAGLHAVEHRRIELLTFCLQSRCSTN